MDLVELRKDINGEEDCLNYYYNLNEDSNIGDKPEQFQILKLIGKGAFGKVYKVRSLINKQIYAMKIFNNNIDIIKKNIKKKFYHPNIIRIYKTFEADNKICIIMEFMENGNLRDNIIMNKDINNILDEDQILSFLLQSMWALYYFHKEGYILRNIKPENILIDDNMKIKFGEFLSTEKKVGQSLEVHPYESLGDNKIWKETKKYLSIQLEEKQSDIYSLGLVFKELIDNNDYSSKIKNIIKEMTKVEDIDELTKKVRTNYIFEIIGNTYCEKQKNSSIDAIVLCLKSLKSIENEFKGGINSSGTEINPVVNTFHKILYEIIYNQKSDFIYWNRYINELRMALMEENIILEGIDEIEPDYAYLYIINALIKEKRKSFIKRNAINIFIPNFENDNIININERNEKKNNEITFYNYINENNEILRCPFIKDFLGLMRIESNCSKCNYNSYEFKKYIMVEINPGILLNNQREEENVEQIDIESILNTPKESELMISCCHCSEKIKHKTNSKIYSLPNSLVISIKDNIFDEKNCINIKEEIELNDHSNIKKRYELVAILKVNNKNGDNFFYSMSKFNDSWFLSQRYKGIEPIEMTAFHRRSTRVRMLFYQIKI